MKFSFQKKSQQSFEFLILFFFLLVLVFSLIYIVKDITLNIQKKQDFENLEDFATMILKEIEFAQSLKAGFKRQVFLFQGDNFQINETYLLENYLVLREVTNSDNLNEPWSYYEFSKEENLNLNIIKNSEDETFLILEKKYIQKNNFLNLEN